MKRIHIVLTNTGNNEKEHLAPSCHVFRIFFFKKFTTIKIKTISILLPRVRFIKHLHNLICKI